MYFYLFINKSYFIIILRLVGITKQLGLRNSMTLPAVLFIIVFVLFFYLLVLRFSKRFSFLNIKIKLNYSSIILNPINIRL